jgi:hypothetical protein
MEKEEEEIEESQDPNKRCFCDLCGDDSKEFYGEWSLKQHKHDKHGISLK